jgi:EpsI family protein
MKSPIPWRHFLPALLLVFLTALALQARNYAEIVTPRRALSLFPTTLGAWTAKADIPLSPEELSILGHGDFLLRDYERPEESPLNLFLAYYSSQRSGDTIHSPRNCLPGSGWTTLKLGRLQIQRPNGTAMMVNRYVVGNGSDRMLVLYWYQAHGRVTGSEYWAKIFLVEDAIRMNRTDGALVRVAIPFGTVEDEARAEKRAVEFTKGIAPLLDSYIPQ